MARCTKEEALETRSRILDAAEDVFFVQGVSRTSLADVATAAKVTRGAIYWHFRNKSDLFDAMVERVRMPMESIMTSNLDDPASDPLALLRAAAVFALRDTVRNPHSRKVVDIVFHKCELVDPADPILIRQHENFRVWMGNMLRLLRLAIAKGRLPADLDPQRAAVLLHATLSGLLDNWLFIPDSFDLDAQAEQLVDACIEALRSAPSLRINRPA
jgi:TetR/AcrR family acrAB operon transcriptional repressor